MLQRKAVIEAGSNSVKLLVAEKGEDGAVATVFADVTVSRLGAGLENGMPFRLNQEAMARNCRVICDYVKTARQYEAQTIVAVGTMALRSAENREDFISLVKDACGLTVQVISGQEEADLALLATLDSFFLGTRTVIFDVGGGSTEVISIHAGDMTKKLSIPLGCIAVTAKYLQPGAVVKARLEAAFNRIDSLLADHGLEEKPNMLIGIGGTVTAMAAVKQKLAHYNPDAIQGTTLTRQDVEGQIVLYASLQAAGRRQIPGLPPDRADVILGGACIVRGIMHRLAVDRLMISDRGIRHGILSQLFRHD